MVDQCGDSTPAGMPRRAPASRASGPQRATSGASAGTGGPRAGAVHDVVHPLRPAPRPRRRGSRRRPHPRRPGRRRRARRPRPTCGGPGRRSARRRAAPGGRGAARPPPRAGAARRRTARAGRPARGGRGRGPRAGRGRAPRRPARPAPSAREVDEHLVEHGPGDEGRARPLRHPGEGARQAGCVELGGVGVVGVLPRTWVKNGVRAPVLTAVAVTETAAAGEVGRNPASAERMVDLPDPLGPTSTVRLPGSAGRGAVSSAARTVRVVPSRSRVLRSTANGSARSAGSAAAGDADEAGVDGHGVGGRGPGHPDAHADEALPLARQHRPGPPRPRPPGRRRRARRAARRGRPRGRGRARRRRACGPPAPGQPGDGVPHLRGAAGVEHRRGFVEEDERGVQREGPREREPLGLPAGQRRGGGVEGEPPEADGGQRTGDDGGHLLARRPDVLEAEGDVPPDGGRDHPGARFLEHQSGCSGTRAGGGAVEGHGPGQLAGLDAAEQAR